MASVLIETYQAAHNPWWLNVHAPWPSFLQAFIHQLQDMKRLATVHAYDIMFVLCAARWVTAHTFCTGQSCLHRQCHILCNAMGLWIPYLLWMQTLMPHSVTWDVELSVWTIPFRGYGHFLMWNWIPFQEIPNPIQINGNRNSVGFKIKLGDLIPTCRKSAPFRPWADQISVH